MKPEFQKIFSLFEELEVAGETVSLTILSKEGKSTIKLQLESPPSPSSSTTTPPTSAASTPATGGCRRRQLWHSCKGPAQTTGSRPPGNHLGSVSICKTPIINLPPASQGFY